MEETEIKNETPPVPRYTCGECGLGVIVFEGQIFRGCTHVEATVSATCSAICYGESKIDD